MTTLDDWPRVKRVLAEALEREGEGRESYLAEACGTDAELRGRIDRLLATGDQVGAFLETAAVFLEANVHEDLSGRVVDSYRLVSRLAAGGMGQVYLAHDTRLDRPVALKFLSPELTADGDRVRRFRQEARAASSLNHPHIVVVHDFGELGGRPYIVTELIEGETLRRRLQQGPLPMRDVLDVGVQVAGALAAAHARGLVHRDVKPENIMVRPDGYAKVLDFGLAKLTTVTPSAGPVDREGRTRTGMVMGTPRYMSPEQARGLDLDARSDVWSLGVVLYEMGTGRLPFAEDGTVMQFEADRDPHVAASGRDLPPELLGIVSKALHTVRDLRYQNGAELHTALKEVQRQTLSARSGEADAIVPPRRRSGAAWLTPGKVALVALLALAVALVSVAWMRRDGAPSPTGVQRTVAVLPFDNVTGAAEIDHLRLALADEVTNALSGAPSLAVRAMASSRRFVGGGVSPQQAGRELRAGTVVTGHFSVNESELRITVEAVEVEGDRLLWRETIAAPSADSIALRDRLMSRIRDGLLPALGTTATAAARARPGTRKLTPSTSRASRSRRIPDRPGKRSPSWSGRARWIRTTRTPGTPSRTATTPLATTAAGSRSCAARKPPHATRWLSIRVTPAPPHGSSCYSWKLGGASRTLTTARGGSSRSAPTAGWPTSRSASSSAMAGCWRTPPANVKRPSPATRPIPGSGAAAPASCSSADTIGHSTSSAWTPVPRPRGC